MSFIDKLFGKKSEDESTTESAITESISEESTGQVDLEQGATTPRRSASKKSSTDDVPERTYKWNGMFLNLGEQTLDDYSKTTFFVSGDTCGDTSNLAKEATLVSGITMLSAQISGITLDFSGLAQESTLTAGIIEITEAISGISLDTDNVAKEDTLITGINNILEGISGITIDTEGIAQESTLTSGITEIKTAISEISVDTSTLAKEETLTSGITVIEQAIIEAQLALRGGDTGATLTSLLSAVSLLQTNIPTVEQIQNGLAKSEELPTDYAKTSELSASTRSILESMDSLESGVTHSMGILKYDIQGNDTTATNTKILNTIPTVEQIQNGLAKSADIPSDYATSLEVSGYTENIIDKITESTETIIGTSGTSNTDLAETLGDVEEALDIISQGTVPGIDSLAKQGNNASATNTAIMAKLDQILQILQQ